MIRHFLHFAFITFLFSATATAQHISLKDLTSEGKAVFVEIVDINENTPEIEARFKKYLLGEEWGRWVIVDQKSDANFVCRLHVEKKGFSLTSFQSMGARIQIVTEILTTDGQHLWKSKKQQGNVSEFTGFDALSDALRKVIRRSLKKELLSEK